MLNKKFCAENFSGKKCAEIFLKNFCVNAEQKFLRRNFSGKNQSGIFFKKIFV
jgi:hypothetical protein